MSYSHINEPTVGFDFSSVDPEPTKPTEPSDWDSQDWERLAELFGHILRWLITGRDLASIGARTYTLALYLRPALINMSSLQQIAEIPGSPTRAALSKALLELQREYNLKPSYFQKLPWMRERYRMAAFYAHWRHQGASRYELSNSVARNPVERD